MPAHDSGWKWSVAPSSYRTFTGYFPPVSLALPGRLVGLTQCRLVLVREDRFGKGLERRHEALDAVGQRARRYLQPLGRHSCGDAVHGAQADTEFEEEARPESDSVRGAAE